MAVASLSPHQLCRDALQAGLTGKRKAPQQNGRTATKRVGALDDMLGASGSGSDSDEDDSS